jgi:lysyl-tRNA synthetase class I
MSRTITLSSPCPDCGRTTATVIEKGLTTKVRCKCGREGVARV